MSATTEVITFSDIYTDIINRTRASSGNAATVVLAKRYANQALVDMHRVPGNKFSWAHRPAILITHAPYTTGTVSIAAATRTTVTGSSTLWNTAVTGFGFNNARVGGKMTFSGSNDVHEVTAVTSDRLITISPQWVGSALSAATYVYFEDEYALAS